MLIVGCHTVMAPILGDVTWDPTNAPINGLREHQTLYVIDTSYKGCPIVVQLELNHSVAGIYIRPSYLGGTHYVSARATITFIFILSPRRI